MRSAVFASVEHTVAQFDGTPEAVGAFVAEAGDGVFHVSVHACDGPTRDAAVAAVRSRGFSGALDALVQPPGGTGCAAIVWLATGECDIGHPRPGVSTLDYRGGTLVRFGHNGPGSSDFTAAFKALHQQLDEHGFDQRDLWKTWSYLPVSPDGAGGAQAFVDFNLRRAEVFGDTSFAIAAHPAADRAYPANTGVADLGGGASLTAIAGRTAGDTRMVGIENSRQRPAHRYGLGTGRPRPAQFSRAVMLAEGASGLVFMAGTAAVVDSHTVGDTVAEQLTTTLELTENLLSTGGLAGGGLTVAGGIEALLHLVVYVARPAELEHVRRLVADRVPVPATCVVAPLTRDDLLVEVDGFGVLAVSPAPGPEGAR
jgi:enamine deaminase RidA (YjgF/YER057c/UK114 family)